MKRQTKLKLCLLLQTLTLLFCAVGLRAQTVIWQENFDDGGGDNRWYADNGTWQMGIPTTGPAAAHSLSNCAATVLNGNYPVGANSRLIKIAPFAVPASDQSPRLRFWHWYSFACNCCGCDYGVVEVKGTNGVWQAVSPQYGGTAGDWTYASIDLKAYAGQTVQVAFHIVYQQNTSYTTYGAPGWYIDDIALITGSPTFNNPETWENGLGDWYAETGTWQVGVPTTGPNSAHAGTNCAATILKGNYPGGANSRLVSPPLAVPSLLQSPRLRFWQWYSFACNCCGCDYGVVEIKGTNGTWQPISPQYSGSGGNWTYASVDLSAYSGQIVQIAFHMIYGQNGSYTTYPAAGWYIDDISIATGNPVFNNPEGWETGLGDWYAESGTWQVGKPTSGPNAAHRGTNCAATMLAGNYPGGVNSRLVSPSVTVPAATQAPRLRFWHWYSFACNCCGCDYGVVEVKGTNGVWQAVSPEYNRSGGDWTYASVDLSAFAGQNVQFAFHIVYQQNGNYTTYGAPGWYVDDVALVTGTPVFNSPEGWENGLGDWYSESGTWQVGVPASGPGAAYSGTNCAATILSGNYPSGVNSRLVSPKFVMPPAASGPALRVRQWFNFACNCCGCDYGVIEIKAGTNNWTALSAQYTSSSGGWVYPFFDLASYGGQTVQLGFHVVYAQNETYTTSGAVGWYIDDISLLNYTAPPLITQAPANQTIGVESPVCFGVTATGQGTLSYQWYFNNSVVPAATDSSYCIANARLTNAGSYSVTVSNSGGAVSSPIATLTILPLPGHLTNDLVNPITPPGDVRYSNGVFTITGSGEDIEDTADAFQFVHEPLVGDGQIIARVVSVVGGDPRAEVGLMMRESLYSGSKHAFIRCDTRNDVGFRRRLGTDTYAVENLSAKTNTPWLRLTRMGNVYAGFTSSNGINWEYLWFTTLNMSNQVEVGIGVTAHHNGSYATATLDNVTIGPLTPTSVPGPRILLGGEPWTDAEFARVGGLRVLIGGQVGDHYTVKTSSDIISSFATWTPLVTVTNSLGVVDILDTRPRSAATQYYRAVTVP